MWAEIPIFLMCAKSSLASGDFSRGRALKFLQCVQFRAIQLDRHIHRLTIYAYLHGCSWDLKSHTHLDLLEHDLTTVQYKERSV